MLVKELPIAIEREKIAAFCQERGIRKLSLFGSVLRHDFTPTSDIDVLVEYWPQRFPGWDLFCTHMNSANWSAKQSTALPTMLSPYFRDEVLQEAVTIYEQT